MADRKDNILDYIRSSLEEGQRAIVRQVDPGELMPAHRQAYDSLVQRSQGKSLPLYLVPGEFRRDLVMTFPTSEGVALVVTKSGLKWTPQDVVSNMPDGSYFHDFVPIASEKLVEGYKEMRTAAGLSGKSPVLYEAKSPRGLAGSATVVTKDGIGIEVNTSFPLDMLYAFLAHEVGHEARRHWTVENLARQRNDPAYAKQAEFEADEVAVRLCVGPELKRALTSHYEGNVVGSFSQERVRIFQGNENLKSRIAEIVRKLQADGVACTKESEPAFVACVGESEKQSCGR